MVYVVERYLPGLFRSDLLRGLSRLEQAAEPEGDGPAVRYLGSTIVLGDEACFCQFEGPTEAAVAEANRKAGLPFDRIVPAVTVNAERGTTMSSTTIPATVQIRRWHLFGLIGAVAVGAAAITWALLALAVGTGGQKAQVSAAGIAATSGAPALGARDQSTPAEQSVGFYLFGTSESLTPNQLQTVREYLSGATSALTPAERSVGHYLFGESETLTSVQLQGVRDYLSGASGR
jgi:hypothetical protein